MSGEDCLAVKAPAKSRRATFQNSYKYIYIYIQYTYTVANYVLGGPSVVLFCYVLVAIQPLGQKTNDSR